MFNHTGIPDMRYSKILNRRQRFVVNVIEFPHTIFFDGAEWFVGCILVSE